MTVSSGARPPSTALRGSLDLDRVPHERTTVDEPRSVVLLPEPGAFDLPLGDPGAALALLIAESAHEDKDFARDLRESEEQSLRAAEDAQLEAMEQKASNAFWAGMIGGAATGVSGVSSIAAAGVGIHGGAHAREYQAGIEGFGKAVEGGGKTGATAFQSQSDHENKAAAHEEQIGGRHRRSIDDARDQAKSAKDLLDRAAGFYKEYVAAQTEARRAALFRA
jgi:hypothetical protein